MDNPNHNLQFSLEPRPDAGDITATIVNLSQSTADTVNAQKVRVNQGGVDTITATDVEISQGGANRIQAENVTIAQGGAGMLQAVNVDLREGGAGLIRAQNVTIHNGGTGAVYGESVELQDGSRTGAVFARQVHAANTRTAVLVTGRVEGDVVTMMDTRQVTLAGLGFGAVVGLCLLVAGWLRQRG